MAGIQDVENMTEEDGQDSREVTQIIVVAKFAIHGEFISKF